MSTELKRRTDGHTLILSLDGPASRNALSPQVYSSGVEALEQADGDPEVRCVIFRGEGAHFCSGGDLRRIGQRLTEPAEVQRRAIDQFHALVEAIRNCCKPVVAAVEGHAAGGGFSLALACDLVVAARSAQFTVSYGKIGLTPDGGASWHLSRALPRAFLLEALWLARPLSPDRLQAFGLVNRVTDDGQALQEALRLCEQLTAMAPNAVASAKQLAGQAMQATLSEHLELEADAFLLNLKHPNVAEGIAAFKERRPAKFS